MLLATRRWVGATALAATALLTLPTLPANAAGPTATIQVPSGFVAALSDTRATGYYEVVGTGLHIRTEGTTSTDKVAEYVATATSLATAGEPNLEFTNTSSGGLPGAQLVVDFNGDGSADGILVGEPASYGNDWWASNGSTQFVKESAPSHTTGYGSANHGTLDNWRAAFPNAQVLAFGFSLGSGVKGDGTIDAINFAGTRYTFAADVILTSKEQCKKGGWATSTQPRYSNQGDCLSHFASGN